MYSWRRKTDEEVDLIAELYFICDRDRKRIQTELVSRGIHLNGGGTLDERHLHHPQVRRAIVEKAKEMRNSGIYSRESHIQKLQEIRDRALNDDNYKVGLAAEVAVGRAAGLYENFDESDDSTNEGKLMPPEQMSNDQLKARLAQLQQRQLPPPEKQGPAVPQGNFDPAMVRRFDDEDERF